MIRNTKNKAEEYIDFIIESNFKDKEILKKEYPGVIEHDDKDFEIAQEIYNDLKRMCISYRNKDIDAKEISEFCGNTMYSKYTPKIVSKIVSDEIYDALDYISELDFYIKEK